jgi:hypothetical protein
MANKAQVSLGPGNATLNHKTGLKPRAPLGAAELRKARQHPRSGGIKQGKFKSGTRG